MKEAEKYFIKEWGTGFIDTTLQSDNGMFRISMQDIYETMQSYAKEQVDKALKENIINRVEVIDENGRSYVNWKTTNKVELSFQDENRTLKIFINKD